jgi:hypothetical protein
MGSITIDYIEYIMHVEQQLDKTALHVAFTFAVLPPATVTVSGNVAIEALLFPKLAVVFSCV